MANKYKGTTKIDEDERDTTLAFIKGQFLTRNLTTGKIKPVTANTEFILGIALETIAANDVSKKTSIGFSIVTPEEDRVACDTSTSITTANQGGLASIDASWTPTAAIPVKLQVVAGTSKAQFRIDRVLSANMAIVIPIGAQENYNAQTVA